MSDMPGTSLDPETVTSEVAETLDSMDPDELRTRYAQMEAENQLLKSNIGRQNQIHGDRLSRLEQELQQEREKRARKEAEQEEAYTRARRSAMDPQSRLADELAEIKNELKRKEQAEADAAAREEDRRLIYQVLAEAKKRGYDEGQIDTRSSDLALLSLDTLEREALRKEVQELKAAQRKEKEEMAETIANVSGRRMVATGGAAKGTPRSDRMSPEEKSFRDRLDAARARKDFTEIASIHMESQRAGINLQ